MLCLGAQTDNGSKKKKTGSSSKNSTVESRSFQRNSIHDAFQISNNAHESRFVERAEKVEKAGKAEKSERGKVKESFSLSCLPYDDDYDEEHSLQSLKLTAIHQSARLSQGRRYYSGTQLLKKYSRCDNSDVINQRSDSTILIDIDSDVARDVPIQIKHVPIPIIPVRKNPFLTDTQNAFMQLDSDTDDDDADQNDKNDKNENFPDIKGCPADIFDFNFGTVSSAEKKEKVENKGDKTGHAKFCSLDFPDSDQKPAKSDKKERNGFDDKDDDNAKSNRSDKNDESYKNYKNDRNDKNNEENMADMISDTPVRSLKTFMNLPDSINTTSSTAKSENSNNNANIKNNNKNNNNSDDNKSSNSNDEHNSNNREGPISSKSHDWLSQNISHLLPPLHLPHPPHLLRLLRLLHFQHYHSLHLPPCLRVGCVRHALWKISRTISRVLHVGPSCLHPLRPLLFCHRCCIQLLLIIVILMMIKKGRGRGREKRGGREKMRGRGRGGSKARIKGRESVRVSSIITRIMRIMILIMAMMMMAITIMEMKTVITIITVIKTRIVIQILTKRKTI